MNMITPSNRSSTRPDNARVNLNILLDSIRAIAQEGLAYAQNAYDIARYEKLLELASLHYAAITGLSKTDIRAIFLKEYATITPKVGVDVAVVDTDRRVLILKRNDGTWGMPGGWAEVNESPFQTAQRETREETGLDISPIGYIAIAHKTPRTHAGFTSQVNICVAVQPVASDSAVVISAEHTASAWTRSVDPAINWHANQKPLLAKAFEAYRTGVFIPHIT